MIRFFKRLAPPAMPLLHNTVLIAAIAIFFSFFLPSVHKTQAKDDGMPKGTWTKENEQELQRLNPPISPAELGKYKR